jgi:uncharacterized protein YmfQ (DUF2313 family)
MAGKLTGFTVSEYQSALKSLLPQGPAWEDELSDLMVAVIDLASREFQRIDHDISLLIDESDPRTASVTISDWFKEWGIPNDCLKSLANTSVEQWRQLLVTKITTLGLTYTELLSIIAEITGISSVSASRVKPFTAASRVNERLYGPKWDHAVLIISASGTTIKYFTANSRADERLAKWGNELFECLVKSVTPAHKVIVFQYQKEDNI